MGTEVKPAIIDAIIAMSLKFTKAPPLNHLLIFSSRFYRFILLKNLENLFIKFYL